MHGAHSAIANQSNSNLPQGILPGGRLTGTSGNPFPASNTASIATLFYTPDQSSFLPLYVDGQWRRFNFTEASLSLLGLAENTNFDVFGYYDAGVLKLETLSWSTSGAGSSTRATGLSFNGGYQTKSGDASRLYLGTVRTTGTAGRLEDSQEKRFIWNKYNRRRHVMARSGSTSHSYSGAERLWGGSEIPIEFVLGEADALSSGMFRSQQTTTCLFFLRLNTLAGTEMAVKNSDANAFGYYAMRTGTYILPGYNKIFPTESASSTGTFTFFETSVVLEI